MNDTMKRVAVIMAGGKGERFWPLGRAAYPKQFLALTEDGITMLQHTVRRLLPLVDRADLFIVTSGEYIPLVRAQVPEVPEENLLVEPMAKNTSPCIGLAAAVVAQRYGDAVMFVLPADHLIQNPPSFLDRLRRAAEVAEAGAGLVTLGMTPLYPETGYGYIHIDKAQEDGGVYPVRSFTEKPAADVAAAYIQSGEYLWNSGVFIWKVSSILSAFEKLQPDIYRGLVAIRDAIGTPAYAQTLQSCFEAFPSISIDYGIMEKADTVFTVAGDFGWDDVGSWRALERINPTDEQGNVCSGDVVAMDTRSSIVVGGKKLIAVIGITDAVIVDTPDVLLVCDKNRTQDVKKLIEALKARGREDVL